MDINIGEILAAFPNVGKDQKRIGLFLVCAQKKVIELVMSNGDYKGFVEDTFRLAKDFAPKTPNIWQIISGKYDPYKGAREKARVFAEKWQLDQSFIEAMG